MWRGGQLTDGSCERLPLLSPWSPAVPSAHPTGFPKGCRDAWMRHHRYAERQAAYGLLVRVNGT
jgi:hypothetical protein